VRLGAGAVVCEEHDDRVVKVTLLANLVEQLADALIDAIDHRCVDCHPVVPLVFGIGFALHIRNAVDLVPGGTFGISRREGQIVGK